MIFTDFGIMPITQIFLSRRYQYKLYKKKENLYNDTFTLNKKKRRRKEERVATEKK